MICHEKRVIFVHIPKCGGTSINNYLNMKVIGGTGHAYYNAHAQYVNAGYFAFTFVRNPWDRVVSMYKYFKSMRPGKHKWYGQNKQISDTVQNITFEQFCHRLDEFQKSPASGVHFVPMVRFISKAGKLKDIDYIGKVEDINLHFRNICNMTNVPVIELSRDNASRSASDDYRVYYDIETKKIVEKKYQEDIDKFNYRF